MVDLFIAEIRGEQYLHLSEKDTLNGASTAR
jgi:hypothetical protein